MISAGRHTIVPDDIDCNIGLAFGAFCSIASGLKIVSGQHPAVEHPQCVSNFPFFEHGWGDYPPCKLDGEVIVGCDVWIGQDVSILEGVRVGHGATVAAEAVITRDVPPYVVVAGNPAEVKKVRFPPHTVKALLDVGWWNWPDDLIKRELPRLADVSKLLGVSQEDLDRGEELAREQRRGG